MKVRRVARAAALGLGVLIVGGCSSPLPQEVVVRWLLADGRSCIDAAVFSVTIQAIGQSPADGGGTLTSACPADARLAGMVRIPGLTSGVQLQAAGLSSSHTVLYRGALTLPDPVPPALDLTLYFTGGE